jgi:hypothetical protein
MGPKNQRSAPLQMFLKYVKAVQFLFFFDRLDDRVDVRLSYRFGFTFEEEVILLVDIQVGKHMEDPKLICSKSRCKILGVLFKALIVLSVNTRGIQIFS